MMQDRFSYPLPTTKLRLKREGGLFSDGETIVRYFFTIDEEEFEKILKAADNPAGKIEVSTSINEKKIGIHLKEKADFRILVDKLLNSNAVFNRKRDKAKVLIRNFESKMNDDKSFTIYTTKTLREVFDQTTKAMREITEDYQQNSALYPTTKERKASHCLIIFKKDNDRRLQSLAVNIKYNDHSSNETKKTLMERLRKTWCTQ